ncbi:cytochrome P450 [Hyphomonas oceanitis]|uniref:Cytochrome P450 family protein n=1 Tax=Hyphomonas oceanitis SCH89 TaxID=1280953 RepID=A0A059GBJ1_9PROT|nr:cytochrome P450 [Hyphomonas oceanitis]KDA04104.1 cytochrome P450 family protein [Hyphomonas oceanitis SCH89]
MDIQSLTAIESLGFTGGRDSFKAFCATAFSEDTPRFLRNAANELVIYRHEDLRAFGAMPEVGALPSGLMFPGLHNLPDDAPLPPGGSIGGVISNQVFTANPPVHGPVRMTLWRQLNPKKAAEMEDTARLVVRGILHDIRTRSEIDFIEHVAEQLTARFWGQMIGMKREEIAAAAVAVRDMTSMFYIRMTMDDLQVADTATAAYGKLVETAALRSLAAGKHPLVNDLAKDLAAIDLADDPAEAGVVAKNVGKLLAGNLVDGFHTAAIAAANTVFALLQNADAMEELRAHLDKIGAAVMEALRCEPPVIALKRYVLRDMTYAGAAIPKGTTVMMLWAAGNHDPAVFDQPAEFRLDRDLRGVTTFGGGAHICVGRIVATMLVRVLLEELHAQDIRLTLADDNYPWIDNHLMSQMRHMPLNVQAG